MRTLVLALLVALSVAVSAQADAGCHTAGCEVRVQHKLWHRVGDPYRATFEKLAMCESTSRWNLVDPPYTGGVQFTADSWRAVGGTGLASNATKLEQIYRAVLLMRAQGWGAWPVCRHYVGL